MMLKSVLSFFTRIWEAPNIRKKLLITALVLVIFRLITIFRFRGSTGKLLRPFLAARRSFHCLMFFQEARFLIFQLWHWD